MKHGINIKPSVRCQGVDTLISLICQRSLSPAIEFCDGTQRLWCFVESFLKNNRTCVLKIEAILETSHFLKKHISASRPYVRTRGLCMGSPAPSHLSYRGSSFTSSLSKSLCVNVCLVFNPWWIFRPCNMFMCTNKTFFEGVGTWPKPIFRIKISFVSYPCGSKKNQNFLFRFRCTKILDRLKRFV